MARVLYIDVATDRAGNIIQNAAVYLYQPGTTTAPLGSMYTTATGGTTQSNPLISDAGGLVKAWFDTTQLLDVKLTDNSDTAYYPQTPSSLLDFPDYTRPGVVGDPAHDTKATAVHAASAISFAPTGTIAGTNVQTALAEVASEAASATTTTHAGLPSDVDFASAPSDGTMVVDTNGSKIYTRIGGVWKGVQVSPLTPADYPNMVAWYPADMLPYYSNGNGVGLWLDQAGGIHSIIQSTTSLQPTYRTNVVNGKPVVRFDAVDDLLESPQFDTPLVQPMTLFFVVKLTAAGELFQAGVNVMQLKAHDNGQWTLYAGGTPASAGAWTTSWTVMCAVFNGASSKLFLQGTQTYSGSTNIGTGTCDKIRLLSMGSGFGSAADLAEFVLYSGEVAATDRTSITRCFGQKYGITVA